MLRGHLRGGQILTTEGYSDSYQQVRALAHLSLTPVSVVGDVSLQNDAAYGEVLSDYWAGFNATVERGGVQYEHEGVQLTAGRFPQSAYVSSPYSLFISSAKNSALSLALGLESEFLFFSSRALQLNRYSALGFPNRGALVRHLVLKRGALRLGFQESAVYTGRVFDPQYFFIPVPTALLQPILNAGGRPWERSFNDNSIVGFFADYSAEQMYAYGQVLVDDINMNRFLKPDSFQNPDKIAWSVGASHDFNWGRIGFYHAGATKYTFQPSGGYRDNGATNTQYGYSYYPAVEYQVAGSTRVISPSDNYIGYLHGENNLAFMGTFNRDWAPPQAPVETLNLSSSLELTLSGDKSPANPWHQYTWYSQDGQGTRFLEADPLETKLVAELGLDADRGPWTFSVELTGGYVWNELKLVDVPEELRVTNNTIRYFSPSSTSRAIAAASLGVSYRFSYLASNGGTDE